MPRVSNVILLVTDLDRAAAFYTEVLGFTESARGGGFVFLDSDGVALALRHTGDELTPPTDRVEVVLEVDDPEATYAAWSEAGVAFAVQLRPVMSHGDRSLVAAHFCDPDGHLLSLTGWVAGG